MKLGADDFRKLYASMPDEELLSLVPDELTPVARECYEAELLRRSLTAAPVHTRTVRAMTPPEDREESAAGPGEPLAEAIEEQEEEDLAAAALFPSREEAKAARVRLQAAGIPTFLENDGPAGFRLLVPASYVEPAREALSAPAEDGPA
jgi:hypothetical protein